ncbi:MAG: DUF2141 domain-containing protein [Aphanizomenon flos-aquae KM1D3_PB]|uniref:DUF2141 domain-containing protein n=1 Tax=Aphanizomenon flos-aquae TaxID=1176 RepID=UPI00068FE12F|nr:DUF2141 domain-containing protein [Aphanizomenon flos-aquae]QSV70280.1 MAG: DUF2141 domain-containing protein [Aphanizomenon flos-aquae KM1D3_PB]
MKKKLKIALHKTSSLGLMLLLPILGNLLFLANAKAELNSSLTIEVEGLRNKSGQICATLFDKSQGFPTDSKNALQSQCIKITKISQKLTFDNLRAGSYAVALIHDANENGNLDTGSFGAPIEGFGFSNNPEVFTGPPKFNDSAVAVSKTNTDIKIKMKYFFGS